VFTLPRPPSAPCLLKFQLLLSPEPLIFQLQHGAVRDPKRLCCENRDRDGSLSKFAAEWIIRSKTCWLRAPPTALHCTHAGRSEPLPLHCTVLHCMKVALSPSHLHCNVRTYCNGTWEAYITS